MQSKISSDDNSDLTSTSKSILNNNNSIELGSAPSLAETAGSISTRGALLSQNTTGYSSTMSMNYNDKIRSNDNDTSTSTRSKRIELFQTENSSKNNDMDSNNVSDKKESPTDTGARTTGNSIDSTNDSTTATASAIPISTDADTDNDTDTTTTTDTETPTVNSMAIKILTPKQRQQKLLLQQQRRDEMFRSKNKNNSNNHDHNHNDTSSGKLPQLNTSTGNDNNNQGEEDRENCISANSNMNMNRNTSGGEEVLFIDDGSGNGHNNHTTNSNSNRNGNTNNNTTGKDKDINTTTIARTIIENNLKNTHSMDSSITNNNSNYNHNYDSNTSSPTRFNHSIKSSLAYFSMDMDDETLSNVFIHPHRRSGSSISIESGIDSNLGHASDHVNSTTTTTPNSINSTNSTNIGIDHTRSGSFTVSSGLNTNIDAALTIDEEEEEDDTDAADVGRINTRAHGHGKENNAIRHLNNDEDEDENDEDENDENDEDDFQEALEHTMVQDHEHSHGNGDDTNNLYRQTLDISSSDKLFTFIQEKESFEKIVTDKETKKEVGVGIDDDHHNHHVPEKKEEGKEELPQKIAYNMKSERQGVNKELEKQHGDKDHVRNEQTEETTSQFGIDNSENLKEKRVGSPKDEGKISNDKGNDNLSSGDEHSSSHEKTNTKNEELHRERQLQENVVVATSSESHSKDILTIVETQSDTPILLFHSEPESQLTSCDDEDEQLDDNRSEGNINTHTYGETIGNVHNNGISIDNERMRDVNNNANNEEDVQSFRHENNEYRGEQQQQHHQQEYQTSNINESISSSPRRTKQKSALDNLVEAASRPSFHRMESDTKLVDPATPPSKIDKSKAKTHDLEVGFVSRLKKDLSDNCDDSSKSDGAPEMVEPISSRHQRKISNSSNHSSSQSCASSGNSISSASLSSQRYKIMNRDTGKTYDIRDLEVVKSDDDEEILQVKYTLFPSKYDLMELHSRRTISGDVASGDDDSDETGAFTPIKAISKSRKAVASRTSRAVALASNISKGFLSSRSKSEGSPISSVAPLGELMEPFPSRDSDEDSSVRPKVSEHVSPKKDDNSTPTAGIATVTSDDYEIDNGDKPATKKSQNKKSNQQKQRKKKNTKGPLLTIPKNTLPVKCTHKSKATSDFNPVLLISTFAKAHDGPIWRSSFSKDGKYLATGGADGILNIWQIAPIREEIGDRKEWVHEADSIWKGSWEEDAGNENEDNTLPTVKSNCEAIGTEVKFLSSRPIQSFKEHTDDIVDLSWSSTGFLLSGSLDKTVRLWHPTRSASLHLFRHPDAVTSVSFHPTEDRYFLSGGFDKRLRIWNITNGRVVEWAQASHVITTAMYQPDGTRVAAGLIDGKVIFYSVDGVKLKFFTEILCKNRTKKHGKKVTGLAYKNLQNLIDDEVDEPKFKTKTKFTAAAKMVKNFTTQRKKKKVKEQVLITSNDSRLRLVGLNDFCMVRKYKGHANPTLQLKARFSESGEFIIIGSETGKCVIWNTATRRNPLNVNVTGLNMYDKVKGFECFDATGANPPIVTEASFAPSASAKKAFLNSELFPSLKRLDHINHDFSSSIIVTCDYEGTIRVFLRQASFQAIIHAAGPLGDTESAKSPFARARKKPAK